MGKIKILTKLTWGIVILTTMMVVMTTLGIAYGVYFVTETRVRDELISDVNNVITNNLRIVDGQIKQKDQLDGQTLGVVLRGKELSALIVTSKGEVLARYGIYRDLPDDQLIVEPIDKGSYGDLPIANYGLFDIYTAPIKAGSDVFGYLRMARQNTEIEILKSAIWAVVLVLLPLSWSLSLIFSYFLAKRITDPMTKLVKHLESIKPESMQQIVDSPKMDYEVSVVSQAINSLIKRLKENLRRERQITENISHEFKTPLTRIASDLQVGKIKEAESQILELGGNVDALLSLAVWNKTDEKCDLIPILRHLSKLVPSRLNVQSDLPKKLIINLPSSHAIVIWRNILDNAIKHNKKYGYIKIQGRVIGDNWKIEVVNSSLSRIKVPKKFTVRKFRSGIGAGQGIGMSIVADMCKLHELRLEVGENSGEVVISVESGIL